MQLPFTAEQFLGFFCACNTTLVGVQAAFLLSVPQDLGLAVVAVVGLVLVWRAGSPAAFSPPLSSDEAGAMP